MNYLFWEYIMHSHTLFSHLFHFILFSAYSGVLTVHIRLTYHHSLQSSLPNNTKKFLVFCTFIEVLLCFYIHWNSFLNTCNLTSECEPCWCIVCVIVIFITTMSSIVLSISQVLNIYFTWISRGWLVDEVPPVGMILSYEHTPQNNFLQGDIQVT